MSNCDDGGRFFDYLRSSPNSSCDFVDFGSDPKTDEGTFHSLNSIFTVMMPWLSVSVILLTSSREIPYSEMKNCGKTWTEKEKV
ncbi:hypothetical protein NPIL_519361 [Nephila pilipes]|uniref:Uncharacterized protein n=1 Tax=Nephila pilipes TaxID=299642 RepID=A0A8X6NG84_NEPPI|nr:hypothetical protein NPIL_519361 [Nephila pilipes]